MIFGYEAKNRRGIKILVGVFVIFLVVGVFYLVELKYLNENNPIESESNIEFGVGFANDYIEGVIVDYLLTQEHFAWQTEKDGRNFCVIENLYPESELFPLYVWARCGEFILENNELKELSGMSGAVEINYPNEMSFYDISKFSYQVPGDGSLYSQDIKNIFPEKAQERIFDFGNDEMQAINQRLERVVFDAMK